MADTIRSFTDLFGFLGGRRPSDADAAAADKPALPQEPLFPTKALTKFLKHLASRENPAIVDLGPVVGSNVTFFGETLGCRISVEDIAADIDRHVKADTMDALPAFFATRFKQAPESVDGILCWDVFDYLDRRAAQSLASALTRLLRPDGTLLGFFSTAESRAQVYTKYVVVDHANLRYRTYPATRPRQRALLNRDIIKLFEQLRVTDSFLMKTHMREILFRKTK
jgi:predicted SAM-dependent methyltransferase